MKTEIPITPSATPQLLDELLKSAVVLNWDALTQSSPSRRVRVEYHTGPQGAVEYLKMWNAAREYWSLICEYSAHLGWSDGPRFCNGYHSRSLGRLLQSIVMNQGLSTHDQRPHSNAMLEVDPPTAEDIEAAKLRVGEIFQPTVAVRGSKHVGEARLSPLQDR
jgi:hypothetical protein